MHMHTRTHAHTNTHTHHTDTDTHTHTLTDLHARTLVYTQVCRYARTRMDFPTNPHTQNDELK
jgi:hypothetical protein